MQDDKGDAGATAQAGRDLVDQQGVVAFAGSASLQDCTVNGNTYKRRGVLSIPGVAGEFSCFNQSAFAPVSAGPARATLASLYYASEKLPGKNVCAFLLGIPAHAAGNAWALSEYKKITGRAPMLTDVSVLPNDDMTPHVLKAKKAGCDTIIFSGSEQMDLAWLKAMHMQNVTGTTMLFLTPAYTSQFAAAAGANAENIYANSEYEPFLSMSSSLNDWRILMTAKHIALSSFAQGGYLSATLLVEAMKRIKGPITRESVTAALRQTTGSQALENAMLALPFDFGANVNHLSQSAVKIVKLEKGGWVSVTPEFVKVAAP